MALTFGSLFAGIGGFDLGFERAGMVCKWQVEIDEYATRVLEKHWPDVRRWDDVCTWPQPDTKQVDVICGGFPCQDISYAGRGAGLDGERSGLFFEAIRVVRQLKPRYVVLENVAALLTRGVDRVLGELGQIGYDAEWHCIPAAAVGAPHVRDRVFVIGSLFPDTENNGPRWREQQQEGGKETGMLADTNSTGLAKRQGKDTSGAGAVCRSKPSRSEWWATEPDVGRVADGVPSRVHRLRGLGNAVVPQVAEWIGRRIIEADER